MRYVGRVEVRVLLEGGKAEILDLNFMPRRGWHGDALIDDGGHYSEQILSEMLAGRPDGVHDVSGRYLEEFHQDCWGEWDGSFCIEGERMRYRGPLHRERHEERA